MVPRMRIERGPTSVYLAGRRSVHTFGGSMTWSSTEMIFGKSSRSVPAEVGFAVVSLMMPPKERVV